MNKRTIANYLAALLTPHIAPDITLPDTTTETAQRLKDDQANRAKSPSRKKRLQLRAQGLEVPEPSHTKRVQPKIFHYKRNHSK